MNCEHGGGVATGLLSSSLFISLAVFVLGGCESFGVGGCQ